MKNLIYAIPLFLLIGFASCSGTKKSTSNEPVAETAPAQQKVEETTDSSKSQDSNNESNNSITGREIIAKTAKSLQSKLELNEEQNNQLIDILTKTYTSSGKDVMEKFPAESAKTMSKSLVVDSLRV